MPESAIALSVPTLDRLKWWGGVVGAISIIGGAFVGVLTYVGMMPVFSKEFTATLGKLKSEVISHADDKARGVSTQVDGVRGDLSKLLKRMDVQSVETLEDRVQRFYAQKTEKVISLSNIDGLLAQKNLDSAMRQNLVARKAEAEAYVKWIDGEMQSAQTRLREAKQGRPDSP